MSSLPTRRRNPESPVSRSSEPPTIPRTSSEVYRTSTRLSVWKQVDPGRSSEFVYIKLQSSERSDSKHSLTADDEGKKYYHKTAEQCGCGRGVRNKSASHIQKLYISASPKIQKLKLEIELQFIIRSSLSLGGRLLRLLTSQSHCFTIQRRCGGRLEGSG
jgi:hypothetical protein